MTQSSRGRRPDRGARRATRALAACAGALATLCGAHAGADAVSREWFGSPVSGTTYDVERDAASRAKHLVAPDGRRFPSTASILEAETLALAPLQRLMDPELLALSGDPARVGELVDVTFIFRRQPAHEAGVAARERANPLLQAELARQHRILDRIAPLRTFPGGRVPDVATAMRDEARLLSDEEEATLRAARDRVREILAGMRREVMAEATAAVRDEQAALGAYIRSLPGALDFGGSVVLNALSARIPAHALPEIAERFPGVLRIERMAQGQGCLDTAVSTVGAGSWWNAGYVGSSNTLTCVLDSGVDSSHPALSSAVTASNVYHTAASSSSTYGDNSTSTDDLQGHGTIVAGILCSTDSTYTGIAYGGLVLNAKAAFLNSSTGAANMIFSDGRLAADWAINQGATSVILNYGGAGANSGTDEMSLFLDAAAFSLGVPAAVSARNDGPNGSTVGYPGGAFNVLTCGNLDDNGTSSHSDDSIYNTSGRGPTSDGRQKPDICAPGVGITTTAYDWETNPDFASFSPGTSTGTSTVGPLVAGTYSLLQDCGAAAYPEGFRALLLTTAGNQSPYGGPSNTWGYGVLDCAAAYTYRGSVYEGQLTASGPRYVLLRGGSLASGGRATLVWSRQVTSNGSSTPTTYYGIQDLDLDVYDETTGNKLGASASTVDPSEQVAVSASVTTPVYKVYLASGSFTSSYSSEPFAVAAESTSSTSLVNPPSLTCTFTQLASAVAGSTDTSVTVRVSNSGDLTAFAPTVTLSLPAGYSITSGSNPRTLADIAAQSNTSVTWTVRTHSGPSGVETIAVDATTTSFGQTVDAARATGSQTVDVDPPTGTVLIQDGAAYTTTRSVNVTLSATDAHTGVAQMRVRNAGAAWGPWTAYSTTVSATLPVGDGTRTFEAEFVDGVGNVTPTVTDTIVLDTTPPEGTVQIAAGAAYVNTRSVTLTTTATDASSGVAETRFSNDGVNWSAWYAHAPTASWTLASGEGTRTAYVQYRDGAGLVSATASDTTVVDTTAPSGSVVAAGGAAWTTDRDLTLTVSATDSLSGVSEMRFSDAGSAWGDWQTYAATATWTLPQGDGQKTVLAQFRDGAGNVSSTASDGIGLDTTPPTGNVTISGGAPYATTRDVTLTVSASDALNGVSQMRFSNDGSSWSAWLAYGTAVSWTLAPGDGPVTVYAQFSDGPGNTSDSTADTITVDTIAPTGSMVILGDAPAVNSPAVSLDLTWSDGGSGVSQVRMGNDGTNWSAWTAVRPALAWTVEAVDGEHTVYVQLRDAAGNVSVTLTDTILLDTIAPTGAFVLAGDVAYVMPWVTLTADTTANDGPAGSGVAAFRSSSDGGATWTEWSPMPADGHVVLQRPSEGRDAVITIDGEFCDAAGNVSAAASDSTFLVDERSPSVAQVSSFAATVGLAGDLDAVHIGLVAGDRLSLKLKSRTLVKKADAHVDIDIFGPDHALLVNGRYPATSRKPGVAKFAAPATGEYWIVMRSAGTAAETGVGYKLSVSNAPAKGSRSRKGTAPFDAGATPPSASVQFDAAGGLTLAGALNGPMTTPPTLLAPDGSTVPVAVLPGPKGSMKLVALQLVGGTGTYTLSIPATGSVTYQLTLSTGKPARLDEDSLPANLP